eukprot:PhF_6_TR26543/c0_g1_i1/m.38367/K09935/K09935; uncharacterized protein
MNAAKAAAAANSKMEIRFHEASEFPYGNLSIMSPHPVVVRRVAYQSVYHYFLCMKYKNSPSICEMIRRAVSQWELDRIVRKAEQESAMDPEWERVMLDIMLLGNYYKFKQNSDACTLLIQTGNKTITNHCADTFWGDGGDGTGRNHMGTILMSVRRRILSEEKVVTKKGQTVGGSNTGAGTSTGSVFRKK